MFYNLNRIEPIRTVEGDPQEWTIRKFWFIYCAFIPVHVPFAIILKNHTPTWVKIEDDLFLWTPREPSTMPKNK